MKNLYYLLKPMIPWNVRMAMRRILASRIRRRSTDRWPILESAAKAPLGWPGWPQSKKFAFVITHDVEGKKGLDRCRDLAELEKSLGFRSSFNFVPEGEYRVPDSLRNDLVREGFEVGIHDLHHDGSLYRSKNSFDAQVPQINHYLNSWGVVGFRAGFMFHNLEWLQALNVRYDASTFDTDPFEPQPDGVGTIFPFWSQPQGSRGHVELPYTLPQDSTLFLVFREPTADIWLHKFEWIVRHGGMALVNVHPDYINFGGNNDPSEYSVDRYRTLLQHVASHREHGWFALPREIADYTAQFKPLLQS